MSCGHALRQAKLRPQSSTHYRTERTSRSEAEDPSSRRPNTLRIGDFGRRRTSRIVVKMLRRHSRLAAAAIALALVAVGCGAILGLEGPDGVPFPLGDAGTDPPFLAPSKPSACPSATPARYSTDRWSTFATRSTSQATEVSTTKANFANRYRSASREPARARRSTSVRPRGVSCRGRNPVAGNCRLSTRSVASSTPAPISQ